MLGVVAGIDAHFLYVLHRLHGGLGKKMDVGYQRDMGEPGSGKLLPNLPQATRGLHVGGRDTHDFATDFR